MGLTRAARRTGRRHAARVIVESNNGIAIEVTTSGRGRGRSVFGEPSFYAGRIRGAGQKITFPSEDRPWLPLPVRHSAFAPFRREACDVAYGCASVVSSSSTLANFALVRRPVVTRRRRRCAKDDNRS
jgi:hypothetical protein